VNATVMQRNACRNLTALGHDKDFTTLLKDTLSKGHILPEKQAPKLRITHVAEPIAAFQELYHSGRNASVGTSFRQASCALGKQHQ
jgi:hypothetical protein